MLIGYWFFIILRAFYLNIYLFEIMKIFFSDHVLLIPARTQGTILGLFNEKWLKVWFFTSFFLIILFWLPLLAAVILQDTMVMHFWSVLTSKSGLLNVLCNTPSHSFFFFLLIPFWPRNSVFICCILRYHIYLYCRWASMVYQT